MLSSLAFCLCTHVDLSSRGLSEFPLLDNPLSLNLSYNHIWHLPDTVFLPDLISLDLSANSFREIPKNISRFSKLERFKMEHSGLESCNLSGLVNLKELYLNNNCISTVVIPENVEVLDLSRNILTEIPKAVTQLKNLRILKMSANCVRKIPEEIRNLENLEEFYLSAYKVVRIPGNTHCNDVSSVDDVSSVFNPLFYLSNLRKLRVLELDCFKISYIPREISNMENLEVLRIKNSFFASFPVEILNLKKLRILDLSYNYINSIPASVVQELKSNKVFEKLILAGNRIVPWSEDENFGMREISKLLGNRVYFN